MERLPPMERPPPALMELDLVEVLEVDGLLKFDVDPLLVFEVEGLLEVDARLVVEALLP